VEEREDVLPASSSRRFYADEPRAGTDPAHGGRRLSAGASPLRPPSSAGFAFECGLGARARRMVCAEGAGAGGPRARTRKLWWFATYTAGSSLAGRCSRPTTCQGAAKPSWPW